MTDLAAVRAALAQGSPPALVMVESPTNPRMMVCPAFYFFIFLFFNGRVAHTSLCFSTGELKFSRRKVVDIAAVAEAAHAVGAIVCVDNSIMAPVRAPSLPHFLLYFHSACFSLFVKQLSFCEKQLFFFAALALLFFVINILSTPLPPPGRRRFSSGRWRWGRTSA